MELKEFIGKVVVSPTTKIRYRLSEITSPEIKAWTVKPDAYGHYTCYCWKTINGDPFSNGYLVFEDRSLTEAFKAAYNAYSRTKDAFMEEYGYWMRRD